MSILRKALCLLLAALFLIGAAAAESYQVAEKNQPLFRELFSLLKAAVDSPAGRDDAAADKVLEQIRGVSEADYEIARAVTDHWRAVWLDPFYPLYLYRGEEKAVTLERSNPPIGEKHAIVVLGYQLENGEMKDELKGRCKAAAALAKSYPDAIIVCSGGATGPNNPDGHTEAGLMKEYLVRACGIDTSRIFTDESAMTTLENAENTFEILRAKGIRTITIVTSDYHQKWGQVLYNALAAVYAQRYGYSVEIVGNYCFPIEPEEDSYRSGHRIALSQLSSMLGVPRK